MKHHFSLADVWFLLLKIFTMGIKYNTFKVKMWKIQNGDNSTEKTSFGIINLWFCGLNLRSMAQPMDHHNMKFPAIN